MQLQFVLYRSQAKRTITQELVCDILWESIRNNEREGLTGFLHSDHDHFLQYLEGHPGPLIRKVSRIQKDKRHKNFVILAEGELDKRFFPDWDMGQMRADIVEKFKPLKNRSWMHRRPDINPVSLLQAFAAHAGKFDDFTISQG